MGDSSVTGVDINVPKHGELDVLLNKHAGEIAKLREMVADMLPEDWDDIWLLRFILSNGNAEESAENVKFTIKWREENAETLKSNKLPHADTFQKFQVAGSHNKFDKEGAPVFIVRIGLCNPSALMDNSTHEQVRDYVLFAREKDFIICDKLTREKRKLIKAISIQDMRGMKLITDRRFFKALGDSSKLSEKLYPQLLGISIPINMPSFFKILLRFASPFMSKRMLAKMRFCPGSPPNDDITKCPYVMSRFKVEDIPTFLGGSCNCTGGCVNGVPNTQTVPISNVDSEGRITIVINARAEEVVELVCPANSVVSYFFELKGKTISMHAEFIPDGEDGEVLTFAAPTVVSKKDNKLSGNWKIPDRNGILRWTFDNSNSLLTSKTVVYAVSVRLDGELCES